jgi:hypothetical protein
LSKVPIYRFDCGRELGQPSLPIEADRDKIAPRDQRFDVEESRSGVGGARRSDQGETVRSRRSNEPEFREGAHEIENLLVTRPMANRFRSQLSAFMSGGASFIYPRAITLSGFNTLSLAATWQVA